MATTPSRGAPRRYGPPVLNRPRWAVALFALLLVFALALPSTAAPQATLDAYDSSHHVAAADLNKRQVLPTTTTTTTTTQTTVVPTPTVPPVVNTTTTTIGTTTVVTTTATGPIITTSTTPRGGITTNTLSTTTTATPTNTTAAPTGKPEGESSGSVVIAGATVGGLVFAIGLGILAFRCTLNRKERERRKKEMTATLAENFERGGGGDPIGTPRKGYIELGDTASTSSHKEGGGNGGGGGGGGDFYNPHYVQERYGAAHTGNYGMFEETELSVIGGSAGRPTTPYHGGNAGPNQYGGGGYNNYNNNNGGGYYGGGGHAGY